MQQQLCQIVAVVFSVVLRGQAIHVTAESVKAVLSIGLQTRYEILTTEYRQQNPALSVKRRVSNERTSI